MKFILFLVLSFMLLIEANGSYDCASEGHNLRRTTFGFVCEKG